MKNINSIKLLNVNKSFTVNTEEKIVLKDINYEFCRGKLNILKGKSGCGKSTLVSLIGLLDNKFTGNILFDDKEIQIKDSAKFRAENMSFLFQDNNFFSELTCLENLQIVSKDENKINDIAKTLNISSLLKKKARDISKGEGIRLAICRIVLEDKPIMFFDEPTGNLDKYNTNYVYTLLSKLASNHLIIVISHDFDENIVIENSEILYIEKNTLFVKKSGTSNVNYIGATVFKGKKLPLLFAFKFAKSYFLKHIFSNALSFVLTLFGVILCCISFSFSSFSCEHALSNILKEYGAPSTCVISPTKIENSYRVFDNIVKNKEGKEANMVIAYSENPNIGFYGDMSIKDNEIVIPSFKADYYKIVNGDELFIEDISIIAHVIEYKIDDYENKLLNKFNSNIRANEIINNSCPSIVSCNLFKLILGNKHIEISPLNTQPIQSILSSLYIYSGLFNVKTSNNDTTGLIMSSWSKPNKITEEIVIPYFKNRTIEILPGDNEKPFGFDLSLVCNTVNIDYVEFNKDINDEETTLILNKIDSKYLIDNSFDLGAPSTGARGINQYTIQQNQFDEKILVNKENKYYGLATSNEIQSLISIKGVQQNAYIFGIVFIILTITEFYFYSFSLKRGLRNNNNLLASIGFDRKSEYKVDACSILFPIILPAILGSFLIYPFITNSVSSLCCGLFHFERIFYFCEFNGYILILSIGLMLIALFMPLFYLFKKRNNLIDQIKESKE